MPRQPLSDDLARLRRENEELRARADEAERRSGLFSAICDTLADPVLVTDGGNRILLENRRARSLFHATPGDPEERRRMVEVNNFLFTSFLARPRPPAVEARLSTLDATQRASKARRYVS